MEQPEPSTAEPSTEPSSGSGPKSGPAQGARIRVRVDRLVEGGLGFGRVDGVAILIPRAAPGDLLEVDIVDRRRDYARGEVVAVLEAGPDRVEPPCPVYGECGGCDLQHLRQERQLPLKVRAAQETLRRLGGVEVKSPRIVSGGAFGYRSRAQLQVRGRGEELDIGFHARGSHELVPTLRCPILVPALEQSLKAFLPVLRAAEEPPSRLDLLAGDDETVSTAPPVEGLFHGAVHRRIGDFDYELDARCFFQGHQDLAEVLMREAVGEEEGDLVVEMHCGVGLFTLPLARRYGRVLAAESDRVAVRYLRRNLRKNRVSNVEVTPASAEHLARRRVEPGAQGSDDPASADRWFVDPPRTGLSGALLRALERARPRRLTYVSCQPPTLARDLRRLHWLYEVGTVTFLDLFPQTAHLETVVQLTRREEPLERPGGGERRSDDQRGRDRRSGDRGGDRGRERGRGPRRDDWSRPSGGTGGDRPRRRGEGRPDGPGGGWGRGDRGGPGEGDDRGPSRGRRPDRGRGGPGGGGDRGPRGGRRPDGGRGGPGGGGERGPRRGRRPDEGRGGPGGGGERGPRPGRRPEEGRGGPGPGGERGPHRGRRPDEGRGGPGEGGERGPRPGRRPDAGRGGPGAGGERGPRRGRRPDEGRGGSGEGGERGPRRGRRPDAGRGGPPGRGGRKD